MDRLWKVYSKIRRNNHTFWKDRQQASTRCCYIIMNKQTAKSLIEYNPVNERIIRARFHAKKGKVTFIQCYAPTNEAEEEVKTEFYNTLQAEIRKVPTHDLTIVMGDLNAKVGNDNTGNERVMGKYGCGQMNENGELLVDFCGINNLVIGGTIFPHKDIHKLTWNSPNGRDKNQIDHIMINGKWKRSLQDVRVKRGADIASDHFLITANIKLKLKKMSSPTTIKRKFDINKLQDTKVKQEFNLQIKNRFQVLEDTIEETSEPASINNKWLKVEEIYKETSEKVLGYKRQIHKEWITQGTWKLIDERKEINNKLCQTYSERIKDKLRKEYSECNKKVKKATRSDKRKYTEDLAKEAEDAASNQRMGQVYQVVKQLCNKKTNKSMPIKDKQNNTLSSEKEQKERWKEHFQEVLNRKEPENTVSIDITETPLELDIDLYAPTKLEIQRALKSLRNRKAPGIDQLNAELFKADVKQTSDILYPVFKEIWENNIIPDNWSEGDIIRIPKKGDLTNCNNWRGITLLSIPSKVFCKILISRIKTAIDRTLRQEQAGFRQGRSCIDHIFVLRNILEQCTEWQRKIIINFVDFEKAFDSLHRQGLWTILKSYGIPEKK
ncbi:blast:Craniofacial development protein 2 [Mytilus galloprovincialis]|uniref:Blast:Craniofacial development protein 2 n=1 Tax=Mytilus galloprovincialis TaxID=29158 RepID=A0A8B6FDD4_MYTGA|nr:blast:Craniofacial development protein 2 [Mytilus galloprovincialis]